jgi:hypothetical protein
MGILHTEHLFKVKKTTPCRRMIGRREEFCPLDFSHWLTPMISMCLTSQRRGLFLVMRRASATEAPKLVRGTWDEDEVCDRVLEVWCSRRGIADGCRTEAGTWETRGVHCRHSSTCQSMGNTSVDFLLMAVAQRRVKLQLQ